MTTQNENRARIQKKVADAKYMSKPNARNAVVFYDATGRWVFEVYLPNKDKWEIKNP